MCIYIYIYTHVYIIAYHITTSAEAVSAFCAGLDKMQPRPKWGEDAAAGELHKAGYCGPFRISETAMIICCFDSTLFNSTPLAY